MTSSTLTMGQPLTLECSVTAVRGITSRVDIIWRSYDTVLRRVNDSLLISMDGSLVYTDSFNIPRLCLVEQSEVYQCEVVINTSPPVMAIGSVTLSEKGRQVCVFFAYFIIISLYVHINCVYGMYPEKM